MDRLGIDHLSVFGLPPVELVNLAADLGCRSVSMAPSPITPFNPHGYPRFSLTEDADLRRRLAAALDARGVSIAAGSGFLMTAATEVADYAADLEALAELGVKRINSVAMDKERARGLDNFARLAELAAAFGLETMVEIVPGLLIDDLAAGVETARHVGRDDFRLLIDTMHVYRAGATIDDLAALDPRLVGYIQLCDAPQSPVIEDYGEEATFHRLAPGDGELPLLEMLSVLPRNVAIGLEIPMRTQAEAGLGPYERLRPCVDAARALLRRLD
jgi:sugar phosphate isomerase/epimerase